MVEPPPRSLGRDDTLLALVPVVSVVRVALATGMALAPGVVARASGAADTTAVRALVRAVAARELVLGAGTARAWWTGSRLPCWLAAQGTADAADAVGLLAAVGAGRLPRWRGSAVALFALSGVAAETATWQAVRRRS